MASTDSNERRVNDGDAVVYGALYATLMRDLEQIQEEAEAKIRNRIREFENELDRREIRHLIGRRNGSPDGFGSDYSNN